MNAFRLIGLATFGSIALLGSVYFFQHVLGYAPCKMCLWQRWPHAVAIVIGLVAIALRDARLAIFGGLAALTTSAIGFYHAGVEQKWWQGPNTCTSGSINGMSAEDLLNQILAAPIARCDEIAWDFLNISMAGWNGIISLCLAIIWLIAFTRR
tara:strand:+ start:173 stop:631 length:459 start_codon:yes stop_codon:yes gene_type:complete